jgi:hypothetical protein
VVDLGLGTDSDGKLGHLILLTAVFFGSPGRKLGGIGREGVMAASTNYSEAAPFALTNSADAYQYDELMGLLLSFSKARVGDPGATWTTADGVSKLNELVRSLHGLAAVLGGMEPRLHFVRKGRGGHRHEMDAEAAITAHEAATRVLVQRFTEAPTAAVFGRIQDYIADEVASDVEKLQRRHTRVVLRNAGSARRLSSNVSPSASQPSAPSGSYESGSSENSWRSGSWRSGFGGGARRRRVTRTRVGKKLTRRQRRQ